MTERAIVGIDLGTTHTVVAYADAAEPAPRVLAIPQLVSASEREGLPLLASVLYAPLPGELPRELLADGEWLIGAYARQRGQAVPGRLIASAKSWLSYGAVDRAAKILPWGLDPDDPAPRLSPVEASQKLLEYVVAAWQQQFPARRLRDQNVVLTVPASFDEVARELTVSAAERAGLEVKLLEEPQAAFYDVLQRLGADGLERLLLTDRERSTVLVCDVGGGTTDLTLIDVRRGATGVELERVAVGRHLLLGGDNVDLALAYRAEARLVTPPARLEPSRFSQLVLACRAAKETLLGVAAPDSVPVSVAARGAALVGSTLTTRIERSEVEELMFGGFLPLAERGAQPARGRSGLVAFGLPYEHDAAISRHVAQFFARHSDAPGPDALLLNGGFFRAERVRARLLEIVESWSGRAVTLLPHPDPDLAVARGAVAFAASLLGRGLRIGGGTPHGYYVVVDANGQRRALSVVPRGAREGQRHVARIAGLVLRVGEPVRFELLAGDSREVHAPGRVVDIDEEQFQALAPLSATFDAEQAGARRELEVALEGELSAVGTLELACVEADPRAESPRRLRLAFDLRAAAAPARSERPAPSRPAPNLGGQRLEQAEEALLRVFGKGRSDVKPRETKDLGRELERLLGERRSWTADVNRALFDVFAQHHASRRRSEDHERVFWNLAGYCLRPGIGHPRDPERVELLAPLFDAGIVAAQQTRSWQQFFIAYRRIAPGLSESRQTSMRALIDPYLAPGDAKLKKSKTFRPLAPEEMLELAAVLERVPVQRRVELASWLLERTWSNRDPRLWTALGRIGARVPAYASLHHVIPVTTAERLLDHLLRERWQDVPSAAAAAAALARFTGDRARDVSEPVRREVVKRLEAHHAPVEWTRAVRELVEVEESERAAWLGQELPVGLRLKE